VGLSDKIVTAVRLLKQGNLREIKTRTVSLIKKRKVILRGGLAFSAVTVIVTNRCTLKCRNCTFLIHHFESQQDMPREDILRDIDLIAGMIDYTHILILVGGEIFLLNNIAEYVEHALKYKYKFGFILITTNGTVMPSDAELAGLAKFRKYISIEISDYGEKSVYLEQLREKLLEYKISYNINNPEWHEWQQIRDIQTDVQAENNYRNCLSAMDANVIISGGKLYHCGFLASGEALRSVPYSAGNHVELENAERQSIIKYKSPETVPPGCKYCSGKRKDAPVVPTAEQAAEPINYKYYL
jgi:MoaA/NifB/PqqE/SkfB family radical SAM enzyme